MKHFFACIYSMCGVTNFFFFFFFSYLLQLLGKGKGKNWRSDYAEIGPILSISERQHSGNKITGAVGRAPGYHRKDYSGLYDISVFIIQHLSSSGNAGNLNHFCKRQLEPLRPLSGRGVGDPEPAGGWVIVNKRVSHLLQSVALTLQRVAAACNYSFLFMLCHGCNLPFFFSPRSDLGGPVLLCGGLGVVVADIKQLILE